MTENDFDRVKSAQNAGSSEELLGIVLPTPFQCQIIDGLIREVSDAERALEKALQYEEVDRNGVEAAQYELSSAVSTIRELRTAIENVREWGSQWKELAKKLLTEEYIQNNF